MKSEEEIEDKIKEIENQDLSQSSGELFNTEQSFIDALKWVLEG